MVAGYVILAALALIEWMMPDRKVPSLADSKSGVAQMLLLFAAGVLLVIGFLLDQEAIYSLAVPLQIIGTVILIVRFRKQLAASQWGGPVINRYVRTPILGLVVVVVLIAYLISQLVGGADFEDILPVAFAMDHINFLIVMTNLIFAMMVVATSATESAGKIVYWGLNAGVVGFAIGLLTENQIVKRIFTPILGLALLYGIWVYWTAKPADQPAMSGGST
jgi:hypothetical protein